MKNIWFFSIVLWCFCLLNACTKPNGPIEDNLRLRHKGADMPIWVRGNIDSRKIVLFLHGGPGECALCLREYFTKVEEKAAVAYWDQRIAGSASGNADPATLNYPQFAEDLEMAVRLLKEHYPDAEIYLLGHSFGVEMAWQFLTTGNNQDLVSGFVAMNGTFSTFDWLKQVQQWAIKTSETKGDAEASQFFGNIQLNRDNMDQTVQWGDWYSRMFRLGANPVWPTDDKGHTRRLWFKSAHSKPSQMTNTTQYDAYYAREIFTFNRRELLKNVRIPVRLFWGAQDGIMPLPHAFETRELLTVPTEIVVFEQSWHSPFHTEPEKFSDALLRFIQH
jgi:pimeloyl-ACP methyl ester carboxylesterase